MPAELGGPSTAPLCDAAIIKKGICYPLPSNTGYINTYALDDGQGGGVFSYAKPIEVPAGNLSYLRRRVDRTKQYIYAVLGVDIAGNEGSPACVEAGATIQKAGDAEKTARLRHLSTRFASALQ